MESVKQQLQGIKDSLEQRVAELEIKVSELNAQNGKLDLQNRKLEKEVKELKSKQEVGLSDQKQPPAAFVTGTYKPSGAEFTMTKFEEYQYDGDDWYSSHFYTHPNGYKMCLWVHANGYGHYQGTHLSVYVFLMRGEFDNQLKWPFRGKITVKLVNQEEDKDHVVKMIDFTDSRVQISHERVREGEYGSGMGYGQFLSHTELQPKYLKNDCIKFCIKRVELL